MRYNELVEPKDLVMDRMTLLTIAKTKFNQFESHTKRLSYDHPRHLFMKR